MPALALVNVPGRKRAKIPSLHAIFAVLNTTYRLTFRGPALTPPYLLTWSRKWRREVHFVKLK